MRRGSASDDEESRVRKQADVRRRLSNLALAMLNFPPKSTFCTYLLAIGQIN